MARARDGNEESVAEREARAYAPLVVVPGVLLDSAAIELREDVEALAKRFDVSPEAMAIRLRSR